jgi:DNA-binding response OmpR family regulator
MQNISVLLIGDAERRSLIKHELRGRRDITLAGEISEADALRLVPQLDAEVIVLDLGAEHLNTLKVLPWLRRLPGQRTILALGTSCTPAERTLALDLGADTYVTPTGIAGLIRRLGATAAPQGGVSIARRAG